MHALGTIRTILQTFISRLDESVKIKVRLDLLEDTELIGIIQVLNPLKTYLKEDITMGDSTKAGEFLEVRMDIRIVYLPPAVIAATQYTGENPEETAGDNIYQFMEEVNLHEVKPDFRLYGFNNPSPQDGQKKYGYEFRVAMGKSTATILLKIFQRIRQTVSKLLTLIQ